MHFPIQRRKRSLNGNFDINDSITLDEKTQDVESKTDADVKITTNVTKQVTTFATVKEDRNILIRLFGGKTVAVSFINDYDTVDTLKHKIQDISGYPANFARNFKT